MGIFEADLIGGFIPHSGDMFDYSTCRRHSRSCAKLVRIAGPSERAIIGGIETNGNHDLLLEVTVILGASVPEPNTLSILSTDCILAFAFTRRKRYALRGDFNP